MENLTPARHYQHVVTNNDGTAFLLSSNTVTAMPSRLLRIQRCSRISVRNPVLDCAVHMRLGSTGFAGFPGIRSFGLPTRLTQAVRPS